MGINNRQRRAAKQRRRAKGRAGQRSGGFSGPHVPPFGFGGHEGGPTTDQLAVADRHVTRTVSQCLGSDPKKLDFDDCAERLVQSVRPTPLSTLILALEGLLERILDSVVNCGWSPEDLGEVVRRRAGEAQVPWLTRLLHQELRRHGAAGQEWRAELQRLGRPADAARATIAELAAGLGLATALAGLPDVPVITPRRARGESAHVSVGAAERRQLDKVRALLAKAEATEFDEEAEALSAKAQALISRYSLDRLLHQSDPGATGANEQAEVWAARRLWLHPPYLMAKAHLVAVVAAANRCRAVVSEHLGFCTLVGDPLDLEAVELLATSLLVQASAAMVRHGRQLDRAGVSRTRSFRQSFLVGYASRIGERLRVADAEAVRESSDDDRLLPALRDQEARVAAATEAMFPDLVRRGSAVTSRSGWDAGRTAAETALLDLRPQVAEEATA